MKQNSLAAKWRRFSLRIILIPLCIIFLALQLTFFLLGEINQRSLTNQAIDGAEAVTRAVTETTSVQFSELTEDLTMTRDMIEALYQNADSYTAKPIQKPDDFPDTVYGDTLHWLPCDVSGTSERAQEEVMLLGNMESWFKILKENNTAIVSIYITTETGINIGYDQNVNSKKGMTYYDPRQTKSWYTEPETNGSLYVSDAYEDSFNRGMMITFSLPYMVQGTFRGTVTFDVDTERINQALMASDFGVNGSYAMLLTDTGDMISAEGLTEEKNKPADFLGSNTDEILSRIQSTAIETTTTEIDGQTCRIIQGAIDITGWRLIAVLPENEILAPVRLSRKVFLTADLLLLFFGVAVTVVSLIRVRSLCRRMTWPLTRLTENIAKATGEDLDYKNDIYTGDEIQTLSEKFEIMTSRLKSYIANLAEITAEKERIGAELRVATQIQADMLPRIFPYKPECKEFDLYALMDPAKEVGGDFYDYFMVDDEHLAFVIGDVSGKGIPAALFMVISKTLIHNHVKAGEEVGETFTAVNNELCEGNTAGLFTTAWLGILNIKTGEVVFTDAGHELPLYIRQDNSLEYIRPQHKKLMLGGMENIQYTTSRTVMHPGETLLLYTDGVVEATDSEEQLFGKKRLECSVLDSKTDHPADLLKKIRSDVDTFVGEAPQFDDLTMLALTFYGSANALQCIRIDNPDRKSMETVSTFVETTFHTMNFDQKTINRMLIVSDEIYSNIVHYAQATETEVTAGYEDGAAILIFKDNGKPFNPLGCTTPATETAAEHREIGGLGLLMVQKMTDSLHYVYENGYNLLTIKKKL